VRCRGLRPSELGRRATLPFRALHGANPAKRDKGGLEVGPAAPPRRATAPLKPPMAPLGLPSASPRIGLGGGLGSGECLGGVRRRRPGQGGPLSGAQSAGQAGGAGPGPRATPVLGPRGPGKGRAKRHLAPERGRPPGRPPPSAPPWPEGPGG